MKNFGYMDSMNISLFLIWANLNWIFFRHLWIGLFFLKFREDGGYLYYWDELNFSIIIMNFDIRNIFLD